MNISIQLSDYSNLHNYFNFKEPFFFENKMDLQLWKMEVNDQPIFRYIYRNLKPKRHLEFGTWQGAGLIYCLEECEATVWTINMPFGEKTFDNNTAYGLYDYEISDAQKWAAKIGFSEQKSYCTDSIGFIGRFYLEKKLGHRVCQIYCDSRDWDISNYPEGFFDTVLIDGAHQKAIVINDTYKALKLLKRDGIIMWHDFCPPVYEKFECVTGVMDAVNEIYPMLKNELKEIFWINPSWILVGIKK